MSQHFELPAELNIYNAVQIREALLAWVGKQATDSHGVLQISAQNVAEVDGAGLQLLAALSNSGVAWRVVDANATFSDACRTMGFAQWVDGQPMATGKGGL